MEEEKDILLQVSAGSHQAFRVLFDRYFDRIYGLAYSMTKSPAQAEDLAQNIFMNLWVKREKLTEIENFDAFIYRVARNHVLNELRNKVRLQEFTEYLVNHFRETSANPQQSLISGEIERIIGEAVEKLPPQQRQVYILCREEGLSQEEISSKLNISVNTIKQHMSRALKFIRHYYLCYSRIVCLFIVSYSGLKF